MGIAKTITTMADRLVSAINPIRLFEQGQIGKLSSMAHESMKQGANPARSIWDAGVVGYNVAKTNFKNVRSALAKNDGTLASGWQDYFKGHKLGLKRDALSPGQMNFNSIARKTAVGAGIAYGASQMMSNDNPLSKTMSTVGRAGFHTAATASMYRAYKPLGAVYGGLGLLNIMRPGDNMGPY